MSSQIHNERTKLRATWLNNLSTASMAVGVFTTLSIHGLQNVLSWGFWRLVGGWLLVALGLHVAGWWYLRGMRDA